MKILVGITVLCLYFISSVAGDRDEKLLPIFQVVRFPNDPCAVNNGPKNGTCYTAEECSNRGGVNSGSCASGFGVCCVFSLACGQTSSENCTYLESSSTLNAGQCRHKICKCNNNICQMRLDFNMFVITGPSTASTTITEFLNGAPAGGGVAVAEATQCRTDIFQVTNQNTLPSICGIMSGEHVYFDASDDCHSLDFALGATALGTTLATRQWSIKVSQYSCDYNNLAPSGCDQYFYGSGAANNVQTFNWDGAKHLANQDQTICVRREAGNCRICWWANELTDVDLSLGKSVKASVCCGYGMNGMVNTAGYDCIIIPGASKKTDGANLPQSQCGQEMGLLTATANVGKSVCSRAQPFRITFMSDSTEYANAAAKESSQNTKQKGFKLQYIQQAC